MSDDGGSRMSAPNVRSNSKLGAPNLYPGQNRPTRNDAMTIDAERQMDEMQAMQEDA